MVDEKYWIFGKYDPKIVKKWNPIFESYDFVCLNNKNIMLMVYSFTEYYSINTMSSDALPFLLRVVNEYLTHRIALSKKIKYKQYNYITNGEEYILEDDSVVIPGKQNEIDGDLFFKIKQMFDLLVYYKLPKKKISDKQIEEDIKLKLEPLFRKKKIDNLLCSLIFSL